MFKVSRYVDIIYSTENEFVFLQLLVCVIINLPTCARYYTTRKTLQFQINVWSIIRSNYYNKYRDIEIQLKHNSRYYIL